MIKSCPIFFHQSAIENKYTNTIRTNISSFEIFIIIRRHFVFNLV